MAEKIVRQLIDDLDGSVIEDGAGDTVRFSLDNSSFEIDLSSTHMNELREALGIYIASARPVAPSQTRRHFGSEATARRNYSELQEIREWARANGYTVSNRGRIAANIQESYRASRA